MYDELIKRLRECTAEQNGEKTLWHQAADAIEELQKKYDETQDALITADITRVYLEDVLKYIKTLAENYKAHNRWIPVTERLPKRNYFCLVCDDGAVLEGYMNLVGEWYDFLGDKLKFVTHWMPLPEPPKDGEA